MEIVASVSLDLDDLWCYMKIHGDAGWESFPSFLPVVVPRVLKFFEERDQKISFMVVGQDAALPHNQPILKSILDAGHEIGNHSFHHDSWMHLLTNEQIIADLVKAEEAIVQAVGKRPIGFRAPGFSISFEVATVLAKRGYIYDGSIFPTFLGPMARLYYMMTTRLTEEEKSKRKHLFGSFTDGFRSNMAYPWMKEGFSLMVIPVTTFPIFKMPIHLSYILYLSLISPALGIFYFETAIRLCRKLRVRPSILLHPLDFIGQDDGIEELKFFPAMKLSHTTKLEIISKTMAILKRYYRVVTMEEHARTLLESSTWPVYGIR
ncbi:MAG: polysaccharide deacetylase family protein [Anaerolineae bacterium]|nr:polysaccharide deacetylase family protein [Anaerolineae bacterium]MBN8618788.1 polysaccharide deacetylase family protein [Anaerolineae bacterium]